MKKPFDLPAMLNAVQEVTKHHPKAAMFELRERGYGSLFEQLVSCILSIRTLDEVTIPLSEKLFSVAHTPEALLQVPPKELEALLVGTQYPAQKAQTLLGIARAAVEQPGGRLPVDYNSLTALKGVGPKCAKLALGVAENVPGISVDVHVHRVVNRWGLVQTTRPAKTMEGLEGLVPKRRWIDINRLLMPFGKFHCTLHQPKCSVCPVLAYCRQIGVVTHR